MALPVGFQLFHVMNVEDTPRAMLAKLCATYRISPPAPMVRHLPTETETGETYELITAEIKADPSEIRLSKERCLFQYHSADQFDIGRRATDGAQNFASRCLLSAQLA